MPALASTCDQGIFPAAVAADVAATVDPGWRSSLAADDGCPVRDADQSVPPSGGPVVNTPPTTAATAFPDDDFDVATDVAPAAGGVAAARTADALGTGFRFDAAAPMGEKKAAAAYVSILAEKA